jgi:hypothetical protein
MDWQEYEEQKAALRKLNLSPEEYQKKLLLFWRDLKTVKKNQGEKNEIKF